MFNKLKKQTEGFTIIEVLIVLAIAGLIMVVVFLAVPALQRNSRNTQYRQDANNIASAYSEVSGNKGGAVLVAGDTASILSASNAKQITTLNLAAYAASTTVATGTTANATTVNTSSAVIYTGSKCTAQDSGVVAQGTSRQIALYFAVETASGMQLQCITV